MARSTLARLIVIATGLVSQPPGWGQPVSSDEALKLAGVCSRCHVAQVLEWSISSHVKAETACVTCHGPSTAHVVDERNAVKPDLVARGTAISSQCSGCHAQGCPKTREKASCQTCHHYHALVDPAGKSDARIEVAEDPVRTRFRDHMAAGERYAAGSNWSAARAEFAAARKLIPADRKAEARLRMVERRLNPRLAGFEISSDRFDPETGLPVEVRVPALGVEMVLVPGGEFDMGSETLAKARPVHSVRVQPFYLARTEVTQRTWLMLTADNPSTETGPDLPVHGVSWEDAQRWIALANARVSGGGFRLPTEAEWEFAARAAPGTMAPADETAWHRGNSAKPERGGGDFLESDAYAPKPAGRKQANGWGLHDLRGNVWEWCSSLLLPYLYDPVDGRESPDAPGLRVLRGGGYADAPDDLDPAFRHGDRPSRRNPWYGFRLARTLPD